MGADTVRTLLGVKEPQGARIVIWDTKDVSIGRSPENDIVVEDSDVSRRHALLSRAGGDHVVEDLGTFNGTRVNGEPVQRHTLGHRDVIQIADLEITFIQSRKDPAALGLPVIYASQLKGFGGPPAAALERPDATTLGLVEALGDNDSTPDEFNVGTLGDFGFADSESLRSDAVPVDLDSVLADMGSDATTGGGAQLQLEGQGERVSLRLEIEGLPPNLQRALKALLGRVVELPPLRIRFDAP